MGRKSRRLTEQRLVPFEAARHVRYRYDRPCAFHRVPLCGPILVQPLILSDPVGHLGFQMPSQAFEAAKVWDIFTLHVPGRHSKASGTRLLNSPAM
jgi:hypothetical protein